MVEPWIDGLWTALRSQFGDIIGGSIMSDQDASRDKHDHVDVEQVAQRLETVFIQETSTTAKQLLEAVQWPSDGVFSYPAAPSAFLDVIFGDDVGAKMSMLIWCSVTVSPTCCQLRMTRRPF